MNKQEFIEKITNLDETKLTFYTDGKLNTSIFNTSTTKGHIQSGLETDIALLLYSYIEHLIIAKAQGKEEATKALKAYDKAFTAIVNNLTEGKDAALNAKNDALIVIDNFLFAKVTIDLSVLLAKLSPIAILKIASKDGIIDNKILKTFKSNREKIFHQVVLFVRELFNGYLTVFVNDSFLIKDNLLCLSSPYFIHDQSLIIPIEADAYTFDMMKQVLLDKLENDEDFFTNNINANNVRVLYLLRGYVVDCNLKLQ